MSSLDDSGFTSAKLDNTGDPFDAGQYAFFGGLGEDDGGLGLEDTSALEGALEEGLEAPPEEDAPVEIDDLPEGDEDLGYASMFAAALGHDTALEELEPSPAKPSLMLDLPEPTTAPPKPKLGSIALGGLLAASTPTDNAFSSSSTFGGFSPSPHPNNPLGLPFALMTAQEPEESSLSGLTPSSTGPKTLTADELEAELRGGAPPQSMQQPSPQQQGSMFGGPPPPGYGPPPPYGPPGGFPFPPQQQQQQQQSQAGVFTPEMIMQQQLQQQQQPPPPQQQQQQFMQPPPPGMMFPPGAMPPPFPGAAPYPHPGGPYPQPPPGMMNNNMMAMMQQQRPPPPALGAGPPRPQYQPRPHGGGPRTPTGHPHASLAQRLRALNLADRPAVPRGPTLRRRLHSSQYMGAEEIESILAMQWRPLYQGNPYIEDHYYQAFVFKHYGRRNRRQFAPESVRELAPTEKVAPDQVAFVKLDGLGRVPFSNIRRPRPLMDVSPEDLRAAAKEAAEAEAAAADGDVDAAAKTAAASRPTRRLGQEPMLAARIMVEDCMALILDVQDIDRIFVAASGGGGRVENEAALLQRRTLLIDGLAASLRLPEGAVVPAEHEAGAPSDGVFLRLLTLAKGRTLAARALRQLYPPREATERATAATEGKGTKSEPNLRILWAILRNARAIFGGAMPAGGAAAVDAALGTAAKVAEAAVDVIKRLHSPQAVCDALAAVIHGDVVPSPEALEKDPELVLLPLFAPGESSTDSRYSWLSGVLTTLLQRGAEFELSSGADSNTEGGSEAAATWKKQFESLYNAAATHVFALQEAVAEAKQEGDDAGVAEVKKLVPVGLVRSLMQHCGKEKGEELRGALTAMGL